MSQVRPAGATRPITEADRHARKELSKRVRGIRELEREIPATENTDRQLLASYCAAGRGALTHTSSDRPPLGAPGVRLYRKLNSIVASLARVGEKMAS